MCCSAGRPLTSRMMLVARGKTATSTQTAWRRQSHAKPQARGARSRVQTALAQCGESGDGRHNGCHTTELRRHCRLSAPRASPRQCRPTLSAPAPAQAETCSSTASRCSSHISRPQPPLAGAAALTGSAASRAARLPPETQAAVTTAKPPLPAPCATAAIHFDEEASGSGVASTRRLSPRIRPCSCRRSSSRRRRAARRGLATWVLARIAGVMPCEGKSKI